MVHRSYKDVAPAVLAVEIHVINTGLQVSWRTDAGNRFNGFSALPITSSNPQRPNLRSGGNLHRD